MTVAVRSFAKINLGLYIGGARADGFHDLRTVYQTIALHDLIRVSVGRGSGIEIVCRQNDPRVPLDSSNTCHRIAERVMAELGAKGSVHIEIDKRLPVQGGLGAASSNAVATMLALERALKRNLAAPARMRIAAEVGSDLPLFLVGGTVLGVRRGEEVYPLVDLPPLPIVVVIPDVGVSTAQAFADWDALNLKKPPAPVPPRTGKEHSSVSPRTHQLTQAIGSDRLFEVGCALSAWLSGSPNFGAPDFGAPNFGSPNFDSWSNTGASAKGGSRIEKLLLDLVRTGIENDFEKVVFSQYPELRDIKGALARVGSKYASLSGSGSTLYGLFGSRREASSAARRLQSQGVKAVATSTLLRSQYWRRISD